MGKNNILGKSKSSLIAKKIFVEEMSFHRTELPNGIIQFSQSHIEKEIEPLDENNYKCSISLSMKDEGNTTLLELTVSGIFEFDANIEQEQKDIIITKNTVAILFPYLRSQVTLMTAQPDIQPVIIPAININALLKNMEM